MFVWGKPTNIKILNNKFSMSNTIGVAFNLRESKFPAMKLKHQMICCNTGNSELSHPELDMMRRTITICILKICFQLLENLKILFLLLYMFLGVNSFQGKKYHECPTCRSSEVDTIFHKGECGEIHPCNTIPSPSQEKRLLNIIWPKNTEYHLTKWISIESRNVSRKYWI